MELLTEGCRLVAQTEQFVLVDKLPGVIAQGELGSLGYRLSKCYPQTGVFPVHRLDQVTSGLMLFAKDQATASELSQQFANRQITKHYLALSDRAPKKKQGTISGDMAPARRGDWKLLKSRKNAAVTQFVSRSCGEGYRLYLLRPLTGKTHQLRVALKSIGAPILGDPRYYRDSSADRCYLHAYTISFDCGAETYRYQSLPSEGAHFLRPGFLEAVRELGDPDARTWPTSYAQHK